MSLARGEGGSERRKAARGSTVRWLKRPLGWTVLAAVIGSGAVSRPAVSLAGPTASASAHPVGAPTGGRTVGQAADRLRRSAQLGA